MPPRPSSQRHVRTTPSWTPPADQVTYKEILRFEERLKQNAAALRRRRRRYEVFLGVLVCLIVGLSWKVVLDDTPHHPYTHYFLVGLLLVCVTTLILFFLSGVYSERIAYANRYVPHCNRALRSFNMALNMRQRPRRPFPLSLFLSSDPPPAPRATPKTGSGITTPTRQTKTMAPLPPTTNPRGELIFNNRVDRIFRDGYERYRAAFERKRAERLDEARRARARWWSPWRWWRTPTLASAVAARAPNLRPSRTPSPALPTPSLTPPPLPPTNQTQPPAAYLPRTPSGRIRAESFSFLLQGGAVGEEVEGPLDRDGFLVKGLGSVLEKDGAPQQGEKEGDVR